MEIINELNIELNMDNHDSPVTVIDDGVVAKSERPSVLGKLKEAKADISGQDKKKPAHPKSEQGR